MRALAKKDTVAQGDADPHQRQRGDRQRPERPLDVPAQRQAGERERQAGHQRAEQRLTAAGQRHDRQRGDRQVPEPGRRGGPSGHPVQLRERERAEYSERHRKRQVADHDHRDRDARGRERDDDARA